MVARSVAINGGALVSGHYPFVLWIGKKARTLTVSNAQGERSRPAAAIVRPAIPDGAFSSGERNWPAVPLQVWYWDAGLLRPKTTKEKF